MIIAAHLIQDKNLDKPNDASKIFVSVSNDPNKRLPISHYIVHPDWNPFGTSYDADIAILFLKDTLIFSETVRPICLPSENSEINYKTEKLFISSELDGLKPTGTFKMFKLSVIPNFNCVLSNRDISYVLGLRSFCTELTVNSPCTGT